MENHLEFLASDEVEECEWEEPYIDYDGSHETAPCGARAEVEAVFDGMVGPERYFFCRRHGNLALLMEREGAA